MNDVLLQTTLLLAGLILHALAKTYEADKAAPDREVGFLEVVWKGPERWRTMLMVSLILLIGFTGSAMSALEAGGVLVTDISGLAIILISVGYNIDSISKKIFAIGKVANGNPRKVGG